MRHLSNAWRAFWGFVFSEDGFFTAAYLGAFALYGLGLWMNRHS